MQFEKAYSFLIQKLENELPKNLTYHNAGHTKDVVEAVNHLAASENISGYELMLLKTAALFHDSGLLETYKGHEEISCKMAKKWLPQFEYSEEDIEKICALIMATKMPQAPRSRLEEIICDADLFYLGTDSYEAKAEKLYKEMHQAGLIKNRNEWRHTETVFLQTHHYFTKSATSQLSPSVKLNEEHLRANEFGYKMKRHPFTMYEWVADLILILTGVVLAAFALKGFLIPNYFFDGGITGISLLIHEIYHFKIAYVIILANLPFVIMCVYAISFKYALKTFVCNIALGVCLLYLPYPIITEDKLLVSIFGGFFLGIGIGLTMRAGCAIDGIEILALYTWRKTSFTISEIILA
ncbi:MAG: YitT family protein, partial [Bacteroidota bacterium]|nr:YitT family protein [Bacteroidota bacterium]